MCKIGTMHYLHTLHSYMKLINELLFSCVPYVPEPEDMTLLKTAMLIYRKFSRYPDALLCAIQLNDMDTIKEIFLACKDR